MYVCIVHMYIWKKKNSLLFIKTADTSDRVPYPNAVHKISLYRLSLRNNNESKERDHFFVLQKQKKNTIIHT